MPDIIKLFPTVKLNVIGKGTPENLLNKNINNSYFYGYVDDITPFMNKSLMFVAPLFVGSGIRIKILEALAMELPVIATSIAAEGIPKMKNNGIIIADDKESFVRAISLLINNPEQATKIGKNGRMFVEQYFDWEKNISKMLENIKKSL
jgi:glycosyltransferase involved in cell wall biosynthesis